MRTFLLITALFFCTSAQSQMAILDTTWEATLQMAKESGKPIFVDAYTQWCGPCKWMAAHTFTREDVGAFYNQHFINVKMDMEHGEGLLFARAYEVDRYPTFLFIDGRGGLLHRGLGRMSALQFLELGAAALDSTRQLGALMRAYQAGERSPLSMRAYARALHKAGYGDPTAIAQEYLQQQEDWATPENLQLIAELAPPDVHHPMFRFLAQNRRLAYQHVDPFLVDQSLKAGISVKISKEEITQEPLITGAFQEVFAEKGRQYAIEYQLQQLRRSQEEEGRQRYIALALELDESYPIEDSRLLQSLAWTFMMFSQEDGPMQQACQWAERALKIEDNCDTNTLMAATCMRLKKKETGIRYARRAIELGKREGVDIRMPESLLESLQQLE
ncbi:MAG: thioredoxin family protein [Lewinellaceae bacterium]|nr:thioredoxin family protein [Lewinellaceae bacterium]